MVNLLLVCLGNICRSPMALAVLTKQINDAGLSNSIAVQSAGTHASREGDRPDPRAQASLTRRGYELTRFRSRRVSPLDFDRFNWILAMDLENLERLQEICPPQHLSKIQLFLDFSTSESSAVVPDPYYGNAKGFDQVLDLCEKGAKGWISRLA